MRETRYYGNTLGAIEVELLANRHGALRRVSKIIVGAVRRYAPEEHPDGATLTFTPTRTITGAATIRALRLDLSQAKALYNTDADAGLAAIDAVIAPVAD